MDSWVPGHFSIEPPLKTKESCGVNLRSIFINLPWLLPVKKNQKINGCWSFRGDIMIKNLQGQIVKIMKPGDLEQFN